MNKYVKLDRGTILEIIRMYRQDSYTSEQIAEYFGIPESYVDRILKHC